MAVENMPTAPTPEEPQDELRTRATQRLRKRADFRTHLLIYVLVNAFLVLIWWIIGPSLFWPIFPLVGWGIGLAANAWDVYGPDPVTEDKIQREIGRMGS
jgi:hypothetical protein